MANHKFQKPISTTLAILSILIFGATFPFLQSCQSPSGPQNTGRSPSSNSSVSFKIFAERNSHFYRLAHEMFVYVRAEDMPILEYKFLIEMGEVESILQGIPAGNDRIFELYVRDKKGQVQYIGVDTTDVIPNETVEINPILTRINGNILVHVEVSSMNDLVAHYPFTGNVKDSSEYFNHGYPKGRGGKGPEFTEDPSGNENQAIYFSGTDEHINCGQGISLDIPETISFAFWLKLSIDEDFKPASLLHRSYDYTSPKGVMWDIAVNDEHQLTFSLGNRKDSLLTTLTTQSPIQPDSWVHIAATYDGQQMRTYFDGDLASEKDLAMELLILPGDLIIGTKDYNAFFNGFLDDIRIYQKALTADNIRQLAGL